MNKDDYKRLFQKLLPKGPAWSRDPDAVMSQLADGVAQFFYYIHQRVEKAGHEIFPFEADETIIDWEKELGLPEVCIHGNHSGNQTVSERVDAIVAKINRRFSPTIENFAKLAQMLGYRVTIRTEPPSICGIARCGQHLGGAVESNYYWITIVDGARLNYARCGVARCGEPLCTITWAEDLECLFERIKPAHTLIKLSYHEG